jgi:hypothetical protein
LWRLNNGPYNSASCCLRNWAVRATASLRLVSQLFMSAPSQPPIPNAPRSEIKVPISSIADYRISPRYLARARRFARRCRRPRGANVGLWHRRAGTGLFLIPCPFESRTAPFSTGKKVTVVKSCFYIVAEMHDVDLSFRWIAIRPDSRSALHKKAPVTACRSSGLSTPAIQSRGTMSSIATFIPLVVIIGAALVVLTAVVG